MSKFKLNDIVITSKRYPDEWAGCLCRVRGFTGDSRVWLDPIAGVRNDIIAYRIYNEPHNLRLLDLATPLDVINVKKRENDSRGT